MQKKFWLNKLPTKDDIKKVDVPFRKYIGTFLIINIVLPLLIFVFLKTLPPQIPLFYGLAEGEEQLASNWALITPSFLAFLILFINVLVANSTKDEFLKKVLILTGLAVSFFAWVTTLKIFFLIGPI